MSVVGFVVAGGRSLRMGRDKALLPWQGSDLLGHAIVRLAAVTTDVRILCGAEPRYLDRGVPSITDVVADAGPLGGVLTGLEAAAGRPALFLAVDLPLVPAALLARLAALAPAWDAVVPVSAGGPEPLCAAYGPACLEPVRRHVAAGELRVTALWSVVRALQVTEQQWLRFAGEDAFLNLNGPADVEAVTLRRPPPHAPGK